MGEGTGPPNGSPVGLFAEALARCREIETAPLRIVERSYRAKGDDLSAERRTMRSAVREVLRERGEHLPEAGDRSAR